MAPETGRDSEKIAELTAIVEAVRDRVRARYPEPGETAGPAESGNGAGNAAWPNGQPPVRVHVADLMPLVHARDAAQAKIAAIGGVNPRAGGLLNRVIQWVKKIVARALQWFVRDQIAFNSEAVSALETILEALNEHNQALVSLAGQTNDYARSANAELSARVRELLATIEARSRESGTGLETRTQELLETIEARSREAGSALDLRTRELVASLEALSMDFGKSIDLRTQEVAAALDARSSELHQHLVSLDRDVQSMKPEVQELKDIRKHFAELRADWERRVATNEIQFLRNVADLQAATQHRATLMESNFREIVKAQHTDYLGALDRATDAIQKQYWQDSQKIRGEYERLIHDELRVIRMRHRSASPPPAPAQPASSAPPAQPPSLDYARFAVRFRGREDYVRRNEEFYRPFFADCRNVLDAGCGRGEFLELMREMGVPAKGIDLSEESAAQCRDKGLDAEAADLFAYLGPHTSSEFDGIFASQIVEHIAPPRLPEMIRLCAESLRRGGVLAIETPNPACLAIFASHFYLDPTHERPVPRELLQFYMEEAGMGFIEFHELSPAVESMPEIAELPAGFRQRFFGGLDYAIVGRRL